MKVNLNIDRVVLDGVESAAEPAQFERALRTEIGNSLAAPLESAGALESRDLPVMDGGQMELGDHQQLARTVMRQIAKGVKP